MIMNDSDVEMEDVAAHASQDDTSKNDSETVKTYGKGKSTVSKRKLQDHDK